MKLDTRFELLNAACKVFAEQGYDKAKVADICRLAGANSAAVNYHFGSKRRLYVKASIHAFQLASAEFPLRGAAVDGDPRTQLRVMIHALVSRLMCSGSAGHFHRIMSREFAQGSDVAETIMAETVRHDRTYMLQVLRGLAGKQISTAKLQVLAHLMVSPVLALGFQRQRGVVDDQHQAHPRNAEMFAELLFQYTMAGLEALLPRLDELHIEAEMPNLFFQNLMDQMDSKEHKNASN